MNNNLNIHLKNNYSLLIGTIKNNKGSYNRMYQYCKKNSSSPLNCIFQFSSPSLPSIPSSPFITFITPIVEILFIFFIKPKSDGNSHIINYEYSLDDGSTFISAETVNSPIMVSGLIPNTNYNVVIRAINIIGNGLLSNNVSVTTLDLQHFQLILHYQTMEVHL